MCVCVYVCFMFSRSVVLSGIEQCLMLDGVAWTRWVLTCVRELYSTDFTLKILGNMYCDKN